MATHNIVRMQKKLSTKLSFFIIALAFLFVVIVGWQAFYHFDKNSQWEFDQKAWLTFLATSVAVFTWFGTTVVTVRNSIKQHTITTLLQMRLSATYMDNANKVAVALRSCAIDVDVATRSPMPKELLSYFRSADGAQCPMGEMSLRYVLNYFEFLAIGICRGDFDEQMLYDSLGSILENNINLSRSWIEHKRQASPDVYCHVAWLHKRWCPKVLPLIDQEWPTGIVHLKF